MYDSFVSSKAAKGKLECLLAKVKGESRLYNVAGHLFRLTMPEQIAEPSNYAPFRVADGEPLFSLEVCKQAYDASEGMEHVYTDRSDEDMPRIEIYRGKEGWLFGVSQWRESPLCCFIRTNRDFHEARLFIHPECGDQQFAIDNALMLVYAFATAPLQTLEMHASVTVKDGKAYLFLGHSGTGKSTHSRLWKEAYEDAWLLNDDNPILRIEGDEIRVYGSPWSGKTPCYKQESAPVGGIVKLVQAPENKIRPLRLPEAYAHMLASSSGLKIEPEVMDALYQTISSVIQRIGTYELECLPNTDAARLCHDTLLK